MIKDRLFIHKFVHAIIIMVCVIVFPLTVRAFDAAQTYEKKCQGCHTIGEGPLLGPDLKGLSERRSIDWIIKFVKSPATLIKAGDPVAVELYNTFNNMEMADQDLTDDEIKALVKFIDDKAAGTVQAVTAQQNNPVAAVVPPEVVVKGYGPVQPIAFSHKIHAGDNQIQCLYCHYGAERSRHAGIPADSVCMNCHGVVKKNTPEVMKIQKALSEKQPIEWVKVNHFSDFAYFSHERHVGAGKIKCQTCHGAVETMSRLYLEKPMTMGWCLDCHRTTDVKIGENLVMKESEVGGEDCAKCHY